MQKTAVITGVAGQDGSHLSDLLLEKGYKVVGIDRRTANKDYCNIEHILSNPNFIIENGDVTDFGSISNIVNKYHPDEFYNLAANSFVGCSWSVPHSMLEVNTFGCLNCLESIRQNSRYTKFYQASTSERYGDVLETPQNELTPVNENSPYAISKVCSEKLVINYRRSYGLFALYGILFNHEGNRRGKEFVTRKITNWIGVNYNKSAKLGISLKRCVETQLIEPLHLGNLDAKRDWSHASDMVRGMHLLLQQNEPKDLVLASGETHSIREFLTLAFKEIEIDDWSPFVVVDPKFFRPVDVNLLIGDYSKAKEILGWTPIISFSELVKDMVKNDIELNR